jgi:hypothetical protein
MKPSRQIFVCLVLVGLAVMCGHLLAGFFPLSYGAVGTRDGYQYWAAVESLLRGANPYNPLELRIVGPSFGYNGGEITKNPPWTAALMIPWMWGNFSEAIWSWRFIQVLLLALIWCLLVPSNTSREHQIYAAVILVGLYPVGDSFHSGQLGLLLALGVALFLRHQDEETRPGEVLSFCILLTKPHLFLPVFAYLLWKRRWRALLISAGFSVLLCIAFFGAQSIVDWINSMINPIHPELRTPLAAFRSNTLSAWIRGLLFFNGFGRSDYLIGVFSAFSVLAGCLIAKHSRGFYFDAPRLILAGLFLAPYGWMSDYAILAPLLLSPAAGLWDTKRRRLILVGACIPSVSILLIPSAQTHFTWLMSPLVYYLIYIVPRGEPVAE